MSWFGRREHFGEADLSAYLDRQLPVAVGARLEAHVERCEACRAALAGLRETKAMLAELPRAARTRSFTLGGEYARRPATVPTARRPLLTFAPAVAMSLLVCLLLVDFVLLPADEAANDRAFTGLGAGQEAAKATADDSAGGTASAPATAAAPQRAAAETAGTPSAPAAAGAAPTTAQRDLALPSPSAGGLDAAGGVTSSATAAPASGAGDAVADAAAGGGERDWLRALEALLALAAAGSGAALVLQRLRKRGTA
jgi:hypothetical protein